MDRTSAARLMGLEEGASLADLKDVYEKRTAMLQERLRRAPTASLKKKYGQALQELETAHSLLMTVGAETGETSGSDGDAGDFLMASPSFTEAFRSGTGFGELVEIPAGTSLCGRFTVKRRIGVGGMAAVFAADDTVRGEEVAIKVVAREALRNAESKRRLIEEGKTASSLRHGNVVNVYDVYEDEAYGFVFISMELLKGGTLRALIDSSRSAGAVLEWPRVKEILFQVSDGLAAVHQHLVHCDLKPENIWVNPDGSVKITDFGIARIIDASMATSPVIGTRHYMAPEQFAEHASLDARVDIYALGAVAYELLTGRQVLGSIEPVGNLRRDVPKHAAEAIMKALEHRRERRHATVEDFKAALSAGRGAARLKWAAIAAGLAVLFIGSTVALKRDDLARLWPSESAPAFTHAEAVQYLGEIESLRHQFTERIEKAGGQASASREEAKSREQELLRSYGNVDKGALQAAAQEAAHRARRDAAVMELVDGVILRGPLYLSLEGSRGRWKSLIDKGEFADLGPELSTAKEQYLALLQGIDRLPVLVEVTAALGEAGPMLDLLPPEMRADLATRQGAADASLAAADIESAHQAYAAILETIRAEAEWAEILRLEGKPQAAALQAYLASHAGGSHAVEAFSRLDGLLWQEAEHQNSPEAYEGYKALMPGGQHVAEADARLQAMAEAVANRQQLVAAVQAELGRVGLFAGRTSGQVDAATRNALLQFNWLVHGRRDEAVDASTLASLKAARPFGAKAGSTLRDCPACPEMTVLPGGHFRMGGSGAAEGPVHDRYILDRIAISGSEVTVEQFADFTAKSGYKVSDGCWSRQGRGYEFVPGANWASPGFSQAPDHPVVCIARQDALAYASWLAARTGKAYRLPTEAEWEFAARGGQAGEYAGADPASICNAANACKPLMAAGTQSATASRANGFGVRGMQGNAAEWVSSCWTASLGGGDRGPGDKQAGACAQGVLRGGSWSDDAPGLRVTARARYDSSMPSFMNGFRVVVDLNS